MQWAKGPDKTGSGGVGNEDLGAKPGGDKYIVKNTASQKYCTGDAGDVIRTRGGGAGGVIRTQSGGVGSVIESRVGNTLGVVGSQGGDARDNIGTQGG